MTDKSTPKNKNPVKRKILAVVGIAVVLCFTFIIPISAFGVGGKYPTYVGNAIAPLEVNAIASSATAMQTWQGRADYFSTSNAIPLGWDESYDFGIMSSGGYRQFENYPETINLSWGGSMNLTSTQRQNLNTAYIEQSTDNGADYQALRYGYGLGQIHQSYVGGYIAHDYGGFAYPTKLADYGGIYYSTYHTEAYTNPNLYVYAELSYKAQDGSIKDLVFSDRVSPHGTHEENEDYVIYDYNITKFLVDLVISQDDNYTDTPNYILCHDLKIGQDNSGYAFRLTRLCNIEKNYKQSENYDQYGANIYSALITSDTYRTTEIIYAEPPTLDGLGGFLGSALGGFFAIELFPGISLGGVFTTLLMIALVIAFLKIFAGG